MTLHRALSAFRSHPTRLYELCQGIRSGIALSQVRHAANPKPVGTGRANGTRNESEAWGPAEEGLLEVRYEEYFVEHEVSTAEARRAARALNLDDGELRS